jgi:HEPN domain-containing protein
MRHDPASQGLRWLEQARADRHGAQILLDGECHHLVCFIAQQVAEKALKAFLYAQGEEVVVGHSVDTLAAWALEYDASFAALREAAAPLDGYYIPTRYPNGLPDSIPARIYNRQSAEETLRMADLVLDAVAARLAKAPPA